MGGILPRRSKGPRLYLDPRRKQYIIRDGSRFVRTGCGQRDSAKAEKFLAQYIGHKHTPEPSGAPMIAEVLDAYGKDVAAYRRTARTIGYQISELLKWWGDKSAAQISAKECRKYAATKTEQAAAQDLKVLRASINHWHREYGPLTFVPSFYMPPPSAPRDRWLTRGEAARLLRSAHGNKFIRRFIILGLYTGSRPGVTLSLRWSQIDLQSGVLIRDLRPQAKNKRSPPVKIGRRVLGHLRRWRRLDGEAEFVCGGYGDPHSSWKRIVRASGLKGVKRHTLRHTRATWLMQAGVPIWEAAGHLGMTTKTLESVYGKHSPDFQERAANV
jgi:integrase